MYPLETVSPPWQRTLQYSGRAGTAFPGRAPSPDGL